MFKLNSLSLICFIDAVEFFYKDSIRADIIRAITIKTSKINRGNACRNDMLKWRNFNQEMWQTLGKQKNEASLPSTSVATEISESESSGK